MLCEIAYCHFNYYNIIHATYCNTQKFDGGKVDKFDEWPVIR